MFKGITARALQRADHTTLLDFRERGIWWESGPLEHDVTVVQAHHRVVAFASAVPRRIAPPDYAAEPIPSFDRFTDGSQRALFGAGLLIAHNLSVDELTAIHRLTRTLAAQEAGARWCCIEVALPAHTVLDPAAVVQQITAGAMPWPLLTVPLRDGYWPLGIRAGSVVAVRRNDEF